MATESDAVVASTQCQSVSMKSGKDNSSSSLKGSIGTSKSLTTAAINPLVNRHLDFKWTKKLLKFYLENKDRGVWTGSGGKDKIRDVINKFQWNLVHRVNNIWDFIKVYAESSIDEKLLQQINKEIEDTFASYKDSNGASEVDTFHSKVEQLCKVDITCSVKYFDKRHVNRNKPVKSSKIVKKVGQKRTRDEALSSCADKKTKTHEMEREIIL